MTFLEQFDINPPSTSASLQQSDRYFPVEAFFEQAHGVLDPVSEIVRSEVIPTLEEYPGRWHPSGYMVYSLGTHPDLGSLRFHVWPKGLRRSETRDVTGLRRDIHDHVLHIASTVVEGTFEDDIFSIEKIARGLSDEEIAREGLFRVFTFPNDEPSSGTLVTDGRVVRATPIEHRIVPKNGTHTIEAGIFHAPAIPVNTIAATLSFSSNRVNFVGPHILAGGTAAPIPGSRKRMVTVNEAISAKHQLQ